MPHVRTFSVAVAVVSRGWLRVPVSYVYDPVPRASRRHDVMAHKQPTTNKSNSIDYIGIDISYNYCGYWLLAPVGPGLCS